jgi:pimeloyl-ACP methyl ester carboxylesterase
MAASDFRVNGEKRAVHRTLMAERMPRAKTVMVPRGHHYVFISHPDIVEREIRAFLE